MLTRKTRRILFYTLVVLFFVLGIGATLYAEGWRINFSTFHPEKVGAIFVSSSPSDASISLDGTPEPNQAGFLSQGTLISDLFPRTYRLSLHKEGYDDWTENAGVLPSLVIPFKYAVLVPTIATSVPGGASVTAFFASNGTVITESATGTIERDGTSTLKGYLVDKTAGTQAIFVKNPTNGTYGLYDFTTATSTNISTLFAKNGFSLTNASVMIDPFDESNIIAADGQAIAILNLNQPKNFQIENAPSGETIDSPLAPGQSFIAWSESENSSTTSTVVFYDRSTRDIANVILTLPAKTNALTWIKSNLLGIVQSDGSFYLYDTDSNNLRKLADSVHAFAATDDGQSIAALESNSLEVFSFSDNNYYRFNVPNPSVAQSLTWYKDKEHLFVNYPDHVSFLDLEDASLSNFTTVGNGTSPFYDPKTNSLYFIDPQGNLVRFDFPG